MVAMESDITDTDGETAPGLNPQGRSGGRHSQGISHPSRLLSPERSLKGWRYGLGVLGLATVYFLMARLSIAALGIEAKASPLWPPAGIALGMVILGGRSLWWGVVLGASWVSLSFGVPWWGALLGALGNGLQALVGAALLRWQRFDPSLQRVQEVLKFLWLAVLITPLVNATYGTVQGIAMGRVPLDQGLNNGVLLWLGDGMGILVMTPLILAWGMAQPPRSRPISVIAPASPPEGAPWRLEASLWLGLLLSISWMVFGSTTGSAIANYPLEYLPFPFIVWAALRLGQRGTALCILLVAIVAVVGAVMSGGPFITKAQGNLEEAILLMQAYLSVVGVTALVLAATVAERRASEEQLRQSQRSLANAQRIARIGNWDWEQGSPDPAMSWSVELYGILGYDPATIQPSREAFLQAIHPDDRPRAIAALAEAQPLPISQDYRLCLPDGSERVVAEQVEVTPQGITGTVQDITERKQAEAARRESEQLRATMYRYLSRELAEQLLQNGEPHLGGDRQLVSILFSDIRGYTTLAETLEPERVVSLLNEYFEAMVDVIFEQKGTLDKFIGDAIMAVYGSPIPQTDHAQRAVTTALEMRQRLADLNHQRQAQSLPPLAIGIGINSDAVITGNIGSSRRMEFTAIGDGVNLSSRLEGATKLYGCDVIISENTHRHCERLVVRTLDYIRVKGKSQPVQIYELLGQGDYALSGAQAALIEQYDQGRQAFQGRDFERAIAHFDAALGIAPHDQASHLQRQRCQILIATPPPPNWDGTWDLESK